MYCSLSSSTSSLSSSFTNFSCLSDGGISSMSTAALSNDVEYAYNDEVQRFIFSAFTGIVWYNGIEFIIVCFVTFQ